MLDNKIKLTQKFNREKIIYILVFLLYSTLAIIVFIYSLKFLTKTMDSVFAVPQNSDMEAKYGQLHLTEYNLLAKKLGLQTKNNNSVSEQAPVVVVNEQLPVVVPPENLADTLNPEAPETDVSSEINEEIGPDISAQNENLNIKPTISVINSTLTTGLAGGLKNDLQKSGLEASTGNIRPTVSQTIIKVKNSYNQNSEYFMEIKKIVSAKYDFIIGVLDETANQDIQIIIGNK